MAGIVPTMGLASSPAGGCEMTPDPHDLITEAHHQVAGMMSLIGEAGELQPMRGADLYFLLKAVDDRMQVALRLLEQAPTENS